MRFRNFRTCDDVDVELVINSVKCSYFKSKKLNAYTSWSLLGLCSGWCWLSFEFHSETWYPSAMKNAISMPFKKAERTCRRDVIISSTNQNSGRLPWESKMILCLPEFWGPLSTWKRVFGPKVTDIHFWDKILKRSTSKFRFFSTNINQTYLSKKYYPLLRH